MEWYEDRNKLAETVQFVMQFSCCFGWAAFASDRTACCNYKEEDKTWVNCRKTICDGITDSVGIGLEYMVE